eukprot:5030420-Alexandrium_andersonii.AAC.1
MAAMTLAEEERRAQSAPPARKCAVGSVDANPVAPKRGASVPKKTGQTEQVARAHKWDAPDFLELAVPGPV